MPWSRPTAWYSCSVLHFAADGALWVNLSAGELDQLSLGNGQMVGQPIDPLDGIAVDCSISGTKLIACSATSPSFPCSTSAHRTRRYSTSSTPTPRPNPGLGAGHVVVEVDVTPDGRTLAVLEGAHLVLFDVATGETLAQAGGRNLTRAEWHEYLPDAGPYQRTCPQWP